MEDSCGNEWWMNDSCGKELYHGENMEACEVGE